MYIFSLCVQSLMHLVSPLSRRIYAEEKAKVVAAVRGTEFITFLAALAVLHQDDMKKIMNCTRML